MLTTMKSFLITCLEALILTAFVAALGWSCCCVKRYDAEMDATRRYKPCGSR